MEKIVRCYDEDVKQFYYGDVPIIDKPASDEVEGAIEEDEALAFMILDTFLAPKQDGKEVIEKDGEEGIKMVVG